MSARPAGTDCISDFWRALVHDPDTLEAVRSRLKAVMAPGAPDPMIKEMLLVAVSTANGCNLCIHSHTASAKAKGMTAKMNGELLAVIGMAMQTNGLVRGLGVEAEESFRLSAGFATCNGPRTNNGAARGAQTEDRQTRPLASNPSAPWKGASSLWVRTPLNNCRFGW